MPDLENVIRGLECCSTSERYNRKDCMKCPYNMPDGIACCSLRQLRLDAISLLKAQKSEYERGKRDGVNQYLREREEDEEYEY